MINAQTEVELPTQFSPAMNLTDPIYDPPSQLYPEAGQECAAPHQKSGEAYGEVETLLGGVVQSGQRQWRSERAMEPRGQEASEADDGHRASEGKAGEDQDEGKTEHGATQTTDPSRLKPFGMTILGTNSAQLKLCPSTQMESVP